MKQHIDLGGADDRFTQALHEAALPLLQVMQDRSDIAPSTLASVFTILCLEHVVLVAKAAGYDKMLFLAGLMELAAFVYDDEHRSAPAGVQ